MAIPTYDTLMLPVLPVFNSGGVLTRADVEEALSTTLSLTAEERAARLPSGTMTVLRSRIGWAITYLRQAELIERLQRGKYRVTKSGKSLLASRPTSIDGKLLEKVSASFAKWVQQSKGTTARHTGASAASSPAEDEADPSESIESAYAKIRAKLSLELKDELGHVAPKRFEEIVLAVLVAMGYGGSRKDAARVVGGSGDGGIDGVIKEDKLGLDVIYVQAKRWTTASVGRPDIQQFVGALQGHRARKGVFITTAEFTKEAIDYARNLDVKVVLIGGTQLAELMIDYNIGVAVETTYEVKRIDSDYFSEE